MLHSVEGCPSSRKRYCGPSAFSIITGLPYMESLMMLKIEKHRRNPYTSLSSTIIRGTHTAYMRDGLQKLGYHLERIPVDETITFARWLRERSPELRKQMVLVVAGNHFMVVEGNKACDGIVRTPVFISKMKGRRKRMEEAFIVHCPAKKVSAPRLQITKVIDNQKKETGRRVAAYAAKYREVKKLLNDLGLELSKEYDGIEICRPNGQIEDVSSRFFTGKEKWGDALEWLRYLKQNDIMSQTE